MLAANIVSPFENSITRSNLEKFEYRWSQKITKFAYLLAPRFDRRIIKSISCCSHLKNDSVHVCVVNKISVIYKFLYVASFIVAGSLGPVDVINSCYVDCTELYQRLRGLF